MSIFKYKINLIIIILVGNFSFSKAEMQTDSTYYYLLGKIQKYDKSDPDSTYFFANKLIQYHKSQSNDSLVIRTRQNLGIAYKLNNKTDSSLSQYHQALKLAKQGNYPSLIARSHLLIGNVYNGNSDYPKAIAHYKLALKLAQQHNHPRTQSIVYMQLGHIYMEQANYQKALSTYLKANTIIENNNFKYLKFGALFNISNVYIQTKQWDVGIQKLNELLNHASDNEDLYSVSVINNNLGTAYESKKQYNKALYYYLKSLEIKNELETTEGLVDNYHNLGSVYYFLSKYSLAIEYLKKSIKIAKHNNSKIELVYNYEYLAKVYTKLKKFNQADLFLKKAKRLSKELNLKAKNLDLAKFETEYYFAKGDLIQTEKAFIIYDSLKDHFIRTERSEQLIQMQTLYETEKKEKENELLKAKHQLSELNLEKEIERKNQIAIGLVITLFLLIIIIILLRNRTIANRINKEMNCKLENSNKQLKIINSTKDKFFTIIAHDLRSPLGAILSFSNLIDDECTSSKEIELVAEYNSYLNQSAHNLNSLLENLLEWSKAQLGNIEYQAESCDLSEILKDNIEIQRLKAKEKSISIKSKVDQHIRVFADVNMMNTVIRNLLSNAIKFSYSKSKITISYKIKANMVHLSIQDQGVGITQNQQGKLFKIDSNQSTLGTNNETGTGLGLILCEEFVKKNGGEIWIESEVGKGSTFTFTIPLTES